MRRGVRAVSERSNRGTPQEWRGYRRLGAVVIVSAVRDLEKPTRAGGESVRAGESARATAPPGTTASARAGRGFDGEIRPVMKAAAPSRLARRLPAGDGVFRRLHHPIRLPRMDLCRGACATLAAPSRSLLELFRLVGPRVSRQPGGFFASPRSLSVAGDSVPLRYRVR